MPALASSRDIRESILCVRGQVLTGSHLEHGHARAERFNVGLLQVSREDALQSAVEQMAPQQLNTPRGQASAGSTTYIMYKSKSGNMLTADNLLVMKKVRLPTTRSWSILQLFTHAQFFEWEDQGVV